jgi:hypothetical protein
MKMSVSAWICLLLLWLTPAQAQDDPVVGRFSGELDGRHYQLSIDRFNTTTYDGILLVDGDRMQLDARRYGEHISGGLSSAAGQLAFRARLEGIILIMQIEDGRRIVFRRGKAE